MNNALSGTKSITKVPNQKVTRWTKCFFFSFILLLFLLLLLLQIHMTLSQWFLHKAAAFSTEQCTSPSLSYRFEVSWGGLNHSLKNYGFLCNSIFFFTCMHAHKSLSKVIITQDCWIRNTVSVQGVIEESLVWSMILQPIQHTSTEEACEGRLAALW